MDRKEVEDCLNELKVNNYVILDDLTVDVNGFVKICSLGLKKLPIKFGKVSDSFMCEDNELVSLEGSPYFVGRDFYCFHNKLVNLIGGPDVVNGDYWCSDNELVSLEGGPSKVGGYFVVSDNKNIKEFGTFTLYKVRGEIICDEELKKTDWYKKYLIWKKLS